MKNSKIMLDVVAKDQTTVVAKGVSEGGVLRVSRKVRESEAGVPLQAAVLATVAGELAGLTAAGVADRVTVILPEQVLIRAAEAQKLKNQGVADIGSRLLKGWMVDRSRVSEVEANAWTAATTMFGNAVGAYGGVIVWQSARALYRWEVRSSDPTGSDLAELNGKEVVFTAGANAELGLVVADNQRYNQTAKISTMTIGQRGGGKRYRAFVPRFVSVKKEDGSLGQITAYEASNPELAVEGATDSASAVINALRLHVKAAEKLPKVVVAQKIVVSDEG